MEIVRLLVSIICWVAFTVVAMLFGWTIARGANMSKEQWDYVDTVNAIKRCKMLLRWAYYDVKEFGRRSKEW